MSSRLINKSIKYQALQEAIVEDLQEFVNKIDEEVYEDVIHHRVWEIHPMSHCLDACELISIGCHYGRVDFVFSYSPPYEDYTETFEYNIPEEWASMSIKEIADEIRKESGELYEQEALVEEEELRKRLAILVERNKR